MNNTAPMTITPTQYNDFCKRWNDGEFSKVLNGSRFGQAFLAHFEAYKITDEPRSWHKTLYNTTSARAEIMILQIVDWRLE